MPITGTATTADKEVDNGIDANTNATTKPLTMYDAKLVAFYIVASTGTHTNHIATLQISPDGTNWFDTEHTITGTGNLHNISCATDELRVKITTTEDSTSTVDIIVIIK